MTNENAGWLTRMADSVQRFAHRLNRSVGGEVAAQSVDRAIMALREGDVVEAVTLNLQGHFQAREHAVHTARAWVTDGHDGSSPTTRPQSRTR
jgi:hypothetical protein